MTDEETDAVAAAAAAEAAVAAESEAEAEAEPEPEPEPEEGARPSTAPFGDGRDGLPVVRAAMWWLAAAALMLLLPRQFWAAGFAAGIATVLWVLDRRLNPRPKGGAKPPASLLQSTLPRRE